MKVFGGQKNSNSPKEACHLPVYSAWFGLIYVHLGNNVLATAEDKKGLAVPACYQLPHCIKTAILWLRINNVRNNCKESGSTDRHVTSLIARDSTLSILNKLTLYKIFIRSMLTYTAPVWSNTSSYKYRRLQILQSKCLRVFGNYPRFTPILRLHATLNVTPIRDFIYHLTANFFDRCFAHPNPLLRSIGNYSLSDLHRQCKKYIHKRPKHILF